MISELPRFSKALLSTAIAASLASGHAVGENDGLVLEEIIVTAQKRAQSLQDVPLAVSVISGDDLKENGSLDITSFFAQTPGLSGSQDRENLEDTRIRGVGSTIFGVAIQPSIGYFLDGFYQGRLGSAQNLLDVERVEVINGPTASLFGQSTIAGAISLSAVKPTQEFGGFVSLQAGEYDSQTINGAVNLPINDNLSVRIAGLYESHDGYLENVSAGESDWRGEENYAFRTSLRYLNDDDTLDVILALESQKKSLDGPSNVIIQPAAGADDDFEVAGGLDGDNPFSDNTSDEVRLIVDYALNDSLSLTSSTAYREQEVEEVYEDDGLPVAGFFEPNSADQKFDLFQQDIRLTYQSDDGLVLIGGIAYSEENVESKGVIDTSPLVDIALGIDFGAPGPVDLGTERVNEEVDTKSYSAYGDLTLPLTDLLTLTAGLRYSMLEIDFERTVDNPLGAMGLGFGQVAGTFEDDDSWDNVSGRLALSYELAENATLYTSYSQGWKAGGFDIQLPTGQAQQLDEEESDSFEVGVKSSWLDNTLLLNVAAYYFEYENLQVLDESALPVVATSIDELEGSGLELNTRYLLNENWSVGSTLGYLATEIKKVSSPGAGDEGARLNKAPEWTGSAFVRFDADLADGSVYANLDYSYSDSFNANRFSGSPVVSAAKLVNLRVGYTSGDEVWSAYASVTNLLDEFNYYGIAEYLGNAKMNPGQPRMAKVGFDYNF